jgi:hypothetical protein
LANVVVEDSRPGGFQLEIETAISQHFAEFEWKLLFLF